MKKVKLFCFPYAGGSATVYERWRGYLNPSIKLCPVELSGRGTRFNEPLYKNMNELIEDIYEYIEDELDDSLYSFWGHSMGGLISYELAHKAISNSKNVPERLFISGRVAPSVKREKNFLYKLPDEEFKKELMKLDGISKELYESKELCDIFIPILRSDFKITETFEENHRANKLNCDISVFYGQEDDMAFEEVAEWKKYTNRQCNIHKFKGGHFFINEHIREISNIINSSL